MPMKFKDIILAQIRAQAQAKAQAQPQECSICFETNTELIKTRCNHYFHRECLQTWCHNHHNSCPMCRADDPIVGEHFSQWFTNKHTNCNITDTRVRAAHSQPLAPPPPPPPTTSQPSPSNLRTLLSNINRLRSLGENDQELIAALDNNINIITNNNNYNNYNRITNEHISNYNNSIATYMNRLINEQLLSNNNLN